MRLMRRAAIGEIMDPSDIGQEQGETLCIQGEGLSSVVEGAKNLWKGAFQGKYHLGTALFSIRG